jgi:hypothetical protein
VARDVGEGKKEKEEDAGYKPVRAKVWVEGLQLSSANIF